MNPSTLVPMNPPLKLLFSAAHLLLILLSSCHASQPELRSLLEFKKGITSDPLGRVLDSWNLSSLKDTAACPHTWVGVICDTTTGNITGVILDHFDLVGELKFHTLLDLKVLKNLSLSGNHFTGRLPPSLGTLTSLQHLDLSNNYFYGPIPERINELWGLNYLNLSLNQFKGGFPTGLNNLQQLTVLDLHSNNLWADIGDLLPTLRNIQHLDLSSNVFYGGLSLTLDNVSALANTVRFLNLSHNKLNGEFFPKDSISLFRNLEVLDLSDNLIRGVLPSFGSLPALRLVRLARNLFFGALPEDLLQSSLSLEELDLSANGFTGK